MVSLVYRTVTCWSSRSACRQFTITTRPFVVATFSPISRQLHASSSQWKEFQFRPVPGVLQTEQQADRVVTILQKSERKLLLASLQKWVDKSGSGGAGGNGTTDAGAIAPITRSQVKRLFFLSAIPFVGFGVLDNLLMIIAGEYIDNTLCVTLGLSTMAAAGLGNIVSDLAGVGTAHYVESFVSYLGFTMPALTPEQWDSSKARWTTNIGRGVGLTIGCLFGMFPLYFFNEEEKQQKKHKHKLLAEHE